MMIRVHPLRLLLVEFRGNHLREMSEGRSSRLEVALGIVAFVFAIFSPGIVRAQAGVPKFEVDPYWPKPLPERWVTGEIGGVCVDAQDHIFVVQRVSDVGGMDGHLEGLTGDELNAGQPAPPVMELDV